MKDNVSQGKQLPLFFSNLKRNCTIGKKMLVIPFLLIFFNACSQEHLMNYKVLTSISRIVKNGSWTKWAEKNEEASKATIQLDIDNLQVVMKDRDGKAVFELTDFKKETTNFWKFKCLDYNKQECNITFTFFPGGKEGKDATMSLTYANMQSFFTLKK